MNAEHAHTEGQGRHSSGAVAEHSSGRGRHRAPEDPAEACTAPERATRTYPSEKGQTG